jgi:hypothetical protein
MKPQHGFQEWSDTRVADNLASTSFTARCAAAIPEAVVDTGPSESVLAKKTRSMDWRAIGCTSVKTFGADI